LSPKKKRPWGNKEPKTKSRLTFLVYGRGWGNKGHIMDFLHKIAWDIARMFKDSSLGGI